MIILKIIWVRDFLRTPDPLEETTNENILNKVMPLNKWKGKQEPLFKGQGDGSVGKELAPV